MIPNEPKASWAPICRKITLSTGFYKFVPNGNFKKRRGDDESYVVRIFTLNGDRVQFFRWNGDHVEIPIAPVAVAIELGMFVRLVSQ